MNSQVSAGSIENWSLQLLSRFTINHNDSNFGGLSDIWVNSTGNKFVTVSDKGKFFSGVLNRDNFDLLSGITVIEQGSLLSSKGQNLTEKNVDSESLAPSPLGGFFISFESNNRIMYHRTLNESGAFLPKHSDFKNLHYSRGIEALAIDFKGSLYAIPESPPIGKDHRPIYKFKANEWVIISKILNDKKYDVTDATFTDHNNLIILERSFNWTTGFQIRIRRLEFNEEKIVNVQKLLETQPWEMDNLEGIASWKDPDGILRIILISDDNFSELQNTELLEYKINVQIDDN